MEHIFMPDLAKIFMTKWKEVVTVGLNSRLYKRVARNRVATFATTILMVVLGLQVPTLVVSSGWWVFDTVRDTLTWNHDPICRLKKYHMPLTLVPLYFLDDAPSKKNPHCWRDGEKHGYWVIDPGNLGWIEKGKFIDGKRHGIWVSEDNKDYYEDFQYSYGDRGPELEHVEIILKERSDPQSEEVSYVYGKRHGKSIMRNFDGEVIWTRCYDNDKEVNC